MSRPPDGRTIRKDIIKLRVTPRFKLAAEKRASELGKKLSEYIRELIAQDIGKKPG